MTTRRRSINAGLVINVAIITLGLVGIAILLVGQALEGEDDAAGPLDLRLELSTVTSGLESPVFLTGAGDGSGSAMSSNSVASSARWRPMAAWSRNRSSTSAIACCITTSAVCWASPSTPTTRRTGASTCSTRATTATVRPRSASSPSVAAGASRIPSWPCWSSPRSAPCTRAACSPSTTRACCSQASVTAAPATTPMARGRTALRCWPRSCAWMSIAASPTPSRSTTASPTTPRRAARSTPSACATRGASASTTRPATSTSATWARATGRRSTCWPRARASHRSAGR